MKRHLAASGLDFAHAAWPWALVLQRELVRSLVLNQIDSRTRDVLKSRLLVMLRRQEKSKNGE